MAKNEIRTDHERNAHKGRFLSTNRNMLLSGPIRKSDENQSKLTNFFPFKNGTLKIVFFGGNEITWAESFEATSADIMKIFIQDFRQGSTDT